MNTQEKNDLADASGILNAHGHTELGARLLQYAETLATEQGREKPAQDSEQAPCEQPVAWLYKRENSSGGWYVVTNYEKENDNGTRNIECYDIPLYTNPAPEVALAPDATQWHSLSDDEIDYMWEILGDVKKFARAIEEALKQKNGYK